MRRARFLALPFERKDARFNLNPNVEDLAQLAEHRIPDPKAVGSSPAFLTQFFFSFFVVVVVDVLLLVQLLGLSGY